jgi:hypothetical protein
MKIQFTKQEVEKILLDYANKMVEGYGFNQVIGGSYLYIPPSVELVKVEEDKE